MSINLVLSMFAGIAAGLIAAGTALALEWGWLAAIAMYCVFGTLTLIICTVAAVGLSIRFPRQSDMPATPSPGSSLVLARS